MQRFALSIVQGLRSFIASLTTAQARVDEAHEVTALWKKVRNRDVDALAALVKMGFNPNTPDDYGITLLHRAAQHGDVAFARALLALPDIDVNSRVIAGDGKLETPLHVAVRFRSEKKGAEEVMDLLIERGAAIDAVDSWGKTPLYCAAEYCESHRPDGLNVMRKLLDLGANPDVVSCGQSLLFRAAVWDEQKVRLLVEKGADLNMKYGKNGITVLHQCVGLQWADRMRVKLLLELGADPTIADNEGQTPADYADRVDGSLAFDIRSHIGRMEARGGNRRELARLKTGS